MALYWPRNIRIHLVRKRNQKIHLRESEGMRTLPGTARILRALAKPRARWKRAVPGNSGYNSFQENKNFRLSSTGNTEIVFLSALGAAVVKKPLPFAKDFVSFK